ncbi:MAG: coniferyl aldehyde dehydrogenase [Pseudomonadota bacterium]
MVAHETIQTPTDTLTKVYEAQRAAYAAEPVPSFGTRLNRLSRLKQAIEANEAEIMAAIHADFDNRASHETLLADVFPSLQAIAHAKRHLKSWMAPRRALTDLLFWPGKSRVVPQPLGVVGIIAPWNYPLLLGIGPLVAALAAGNRAIVKPSEFTPKFSDVLERVISDAFDVHEVAIVPGGPDVAQALTELPLDHLLFTGSTRVGRKVALAAAQNLTPVTLELGGKSPVVLDSTADLDVAIKRVVRGKMFNAGQTCIAPDYMLVPDDKLDDVVERVMKAAKKMYPAVANNGELTAIIHQGHYDRLNSLVEDAKAKGATVAQHSDASAIQRRMPLTVVTGATDKMNVMQEEIFGPILPIIPYAHFDEALGYVRARPRPLALYWFGTHKGREGRVVSSAMAGGITINDTLLHVTQENLPFGGVGESGMGAYHGRYGFDTMSHLKPVFIQGQWTGADMFTPPLSGLARRVMKFANRWGRR